MAPQAWHQRLRVWKEDLEDKLGKKVYLWPILLVIALLWHAILSKINEFLGSHWKMMYSVSKFIAGHVPSDPISVTVIITVLIVAVLVVHSYFDTREKQSVESTVELATLDFYFERSTTPRIVYKSKLRIMLKNNTGKDISVRVPSWIAESGDVSIQPPPVSTLQIEGSAGWEKDS